MATLKEIQNCELEILKEVAAILERNNIDYWLAWGTMLGAVRHQGFIPWDDDIDINIRFSDLKRFQRIIKKELPDSYFLQTIKTEETYFGIYPKIRKNGTSMVRENLPYKHNGLWVDIFPLLSASPNKKLLKIQISIIRLIQNNRMHLIYNRSNKSIKDFAKYLINKSIAIVERIILWPIARVLGIGGNDYLEVGINYYASVDFDVPVRKMISKSLYSSKERYPFEDTSFYGVKDFNAYLLKRFGEDYMTPKKYGSHIENYDNVIV